MCLKKRERLKFNGAWHSDLELHERSQVQEMLNRLAEESIRRMEMVCTAIFYLLRWHSRSGAARVGNFQWNPLEVPRSCLLGVA